ncbi:N-6 DNA methylase [Anaerolineales bacterium HSG25]|nr:N-6 DNA methylase [Anaerolineales bacterium HSG25]
MEFINGLPEQAYQAAHDSLNKIGFNTTESFFNNYRYSYRKDKVESIDSVVFAPDLPRNPEHACFTIYNSQNGRSINDIVTETLLHTTAPFHLIHQHGQFDFFISKANGNLSTEIVKQNIAYDNLSRVLDEYQIDLKPQKIVDVKQGRAHFVSEAFQQINAVQLSFWTTDVTGELLAENFGLAINSLRKANIPQANKLVVQLLGATILADTGVFGQIPSTLNQLIPLAHQKFSQYFDIQAFETHASAIEPAYQRLRQINYAGFVPPMLTEIYKQAYDNKTRKELGRFDTPLYLTRRIWDNIPVEFLRPENRVTVDMTCGWGSFLIAGYERLSRLSDMQGMKLSDYLYGNDLDPFTAELAKLGLLLSTHTDSWQVHAGDALQWDWLQQNRPNIIVGNPPFGGNRKKQQPEVSAKFFYHAINQLDENGWSAMLMPKSFVVEGRSCLQARKQLLDSCNVYELWDLAENTFSAGVRAMVIFAHKKQIKHQPVRTRTVQNTTQALFKTDGYFTVSHRVGTQASWDENSHRAKRKSKPKNTHVMEYKLILTDNAWHTIHRRCKEFQELFHVFNGTQKGVYSGTSYPSEDYPKDVNWLYDAGKVLKTDFVLDYNAQAKEILKYPDKFWRPRLKHKDILLGIKVILTSNHDPSWGQRVRVAIERKGYCVSDNFWLFSPKPQFQKENITDEVIAAVLHWKVANAWIIEFMRQPKLPGYAIKTIPFPSLTKIECKKLTNAVRSIEEATQQNDALAISDAQLIIDTVLQKAYRLHEIDEAFSKEKGATFERLCRVYYWDKPDHPHFKRVCQEYGWAEEHPVSFDEQPNPNAKWQTGGIVESVNAEKGTITLWLSDWNDSKTVPISDVMPGWLLRPNVAFDVTIPRDVLYQTNIKDISWGRFYPQEYSYMDEKELFDDLSRLFHPGLEKVA